MYRPKLQVFYIYQTLKRVIDRCFRSWDFCSGIEHEAPCDEKSGVTSNPVTCHRQSTQLLAVKTTLYCNQRLSRIHRLGRRRPTCRPTAPNLSSFHGSQSYFLVVNSVSCVTDSCRIQSEHNSYYSSSSPQKLRNIFVTAYQISIKF